ncbi:MAG TPA: quinone-dependent dihydroorotate dehydrogenase [Tenuifilaceae bacterium]|nr:quinone-dependent dihydroorotate dehydrogenase [Tenuifilaceae bacterium]HPE18266.1 quinone-dependent dihydroorotate dehydrogenase [Tenuifilaceae bacterium]HPJ45259.1 quinone-dependent dihydroorotate dehydrogenase [Tenuifilaceae bacterium]HPQ33380.1 quinone-dependent dihydroorotate dehydrogenase [Tenuifilaceae bacterium]HRX67535.1 quinone-dependent dihydroorotate dehydrogenase [Tenuifilaceae bacterium]
MYKHIIRPILFTLQPETIHGIVVSLLKIGFKVPFLKSILRSFYAVDSPKLQRNVFGFEFKNPVGFAAGFDKNAEFFNELECFGFSFVEIGTVTPKPQPGNQKPRSFRLKKDSALINRMGFNNKGVIRVKSNLEKKKKKLVIGGNIGKNTITPNNIAVEDYVQCFTELYHFVDYFVVNISCPNIANLKELQEKENQRKILLALVKLRKKQNQYKPILLKVSPDLSELQLSDSIEIAQEVGIDGFVATNTTISREGLMSQPDEVEKIGNGGLSGKPLSQKSTEVIRFISKQTGGKMPIIGVGGIMDAKDAIEKIDAGASLIQVYTGFIYEGPGIVKKICKELLKNGNMP